VQGLKTGLNSTATLSLDQRLAVNRDFLTAFASEIIKQQKAATTESTETEAAG
jgi:hypothetical protein